MDGGQNSAGVPVRFKAADGFELGGGFWRAEIAGHPAETVIINSATSVRCRYYARFASYLCRHGFNVLTYDYRGIGASGLSALKGFDADWADWGEKDFEAALQFALLEAAGADVHVVAHSIGGFALGLASSNVRLKRVVTVGAQYAHWRDYAAHKRLEMIAKWHVVMPLLSHIFGYFPAKRLRWMEDTPKGVALDWARMGPRFEDSLRKGRRGLGRTPANELVNRCRAMKADLLAINMTDDEFATPAAAERLLRYFEGCHRYQLRISPDDIGEPIGHFAFFHDRFQACLWPLVLGWLQHRKVPEPFQPIAFL
ncbi:alpha/beta hydrolase family protein [Rhizobium oryzicola]|uniref:Alpha/beta fold hydrolase n=1 Tax=Rhizobium oryzicola TaxID=1232668 RepID=A0ABT8T3S2_9HYPH|nr:alpha/beta fold hydrolase [Rhizobium oryzicola]MDO1585241.1 alpha/beta fold hydrolase [Rhizobium oryzicola]